MKQYKLTIEYDGTCYCGFQRQPRHKTIQGELEKALSFVLNEPITIVSSGRTDSGVHARAHVVSFATRSNITKKNIVCGVNASLPHDIAVVRIVRVASSFHAQYSAKAKIYRYHVWNASIPSPLRARYSYQYAYRLDCAAMKEAAHLFVGTHDFRAFAAKNKDKENTIRTLTAVTITQQGKSIFFTVEGKGFLYNMVRNIVGTLLYVGRGKFSVAEVRHILKKAKRSLAGPTAPAKGLTLMRVIY